MQRHVVDALCGSYLCNWHANVRSDSGYGGNVIGRAFALLGQECGTVMCMFITTGLHGGWINVLGGLQGTLYGR